MTTNAAIGTEDRREPHRNRNTAIITVLVFLVIAIMDQSWLWGIIYGFALAMLWRGLTVLVPTGDPTLKWKVWGRTFVLKAGVAAVILFSALCGAMDSDVDTWFAGLMAATGVAVAAWAWVAPDNPLKGKGGSNDNGGSKGSNGATSGSRLGKSEPAVTVSPEERAAERINPNRIFTDAGLVWKSPKTGLVNAPRVLRKGLDDMGRVCFDVAILGSQTLEEFQKKAGVIASSWGVLRVNITAAPPLPDGSHVVRIAGVLTDRPVVEGMVKWQPADTSKAVIPYLHSLPMGLNAETGKPWILDIQDRNFMVGGISRSGKSSFSNSLIAHAVLHPNVRVAYLDLKHGAEAKSWRGAIDYVIDDVNVDVAADKALEFIEKANADMGERYGRIAPKNNMWEQNVLGPDEPWKLLIIDECSELFKTGTPEKARRTRRAVEALESFNQQGLGAGYTLIMMTQRPKEDTLPTSIRDNASTKLAFTVEEGGMTGALGNDYAPSRPELDPREIAERGRAVVRDRMSRPQANLIQMRYLTDPLKEEVVLRATAMRREAAERGEPFVWLDSDLPAALGEPRAKWFNRECIAGLKYDAITEHDSQDYAEPEPEFVEPEPEFTDEELAAVTLPLETISTSEIDEKSSSTLEGVFPPENVTTEDTRPLDTGATKLPKQATTGENEDGTTGADWKF